ncbi:unnamed protein product [Echinostoma caproni]|uniref:Mannose-P-dolichol utilization defect 1 protein homolog n=1 Tax=Echinostoma caproni TaxID=27848 RepID=A0A3P8GIN8_9TREM|nr:unnamed protein product [Echinostoma caproni]
MAGLESGFLANSLGQTFTFNQIGIAVYFHIQLLQIHANWRHGSTGQLSAITVLMFALGSTARIFTSIQETGDNLIIITFLLSTLCNYTLLAQIIYYWNSPIKASKDQRKQN